MLTSGNIANPAAKQTDQSINQSITTERAKTNSNNLLQG
tara:strand:+ start:145 stop:261 length:117 start_codon:yes stop_codon:yes gene_type:complete